MRTKNSSRKSCKHNPPCSTAQRAINHPEDDNSRNFTDDQFIQRLIDAGWTREEAETELKSIEEDVESEL